jgi:hypothetical protein
MSSRSALILHLVILSKALAGLTWFSVSMR